MKRMTPREKLISSLINKLKVEALKGDFEAAQKLMSRLHSYFHSITSADDAVQTESKLKTKIEEELKE